MLQDLEKNLGLCKTLSLWITGFQLQSSCEYVLRACMILVVFILHFYIKTGEKCCFLWGTLLCLSLLLLFPRTCFSVFGLDPSKNLCLKLSKLRQSVERCFAVIAWLWYGSHSDTGRPSIKYLWVSNVWPILSLLVTVSTFLHQLFSFHGQVSNLIFYSLASFSFHSVFHFSCVASLIYGSRSWYGNAIISSYRLDASLAFLSPILFLEYMRVQVSEFHCIS